MESFGCWYKLDASQKNEIIKNESVEIKNASGGSLEPEFDLHVNFWFLGDILKQKISDPYLDIGIKIKEYKKLSSLVFSFPFQVLEQNVIDLASKMSDKINASIVFNEECEIETEKEYTIIKIPEKEKDIEKKLLIFPLTQAIEHIYELTACENKSYITIKFDEFKRYLTKDSKLGSYHDIYIRFRIRDVSLQNVLYFDSEPFNKSLDSAFSGTRVLDFKINEKRNIDKSITAKMDLDEKVLVEFEQVHFLVMEPSSYDMISYTQNQMTCRELEKNLWNDYLSDYTPVELNDKAGHVLAYHWKAKKKDKKIRDFSCFAKINYQKMQMKTVLAYVLVAIGIGVIGSTIVSVTPLVNSFFSWNPKQYILQDFGLDLLFSLVIILVGRGLGKSK